MKCNFFFFLHLLSIVSVNGLLGQGFSSTSVNWDVPTSVLAEPSVDVSSYSWVTMDLSGDGKPDVVQTQQSGSVFGSSGNYYWKLYLNSGNGFSSTATNWSVPDIALTNAFIDNTGYFWTTMDMNGDGKVDLLNTRQGSTVFGTSGNYYWKVYLNTGSGFSNSATSWSIPLSQPNQSFIDNSLSYWATMDINGDNKPDLINTRQGSTLFGSSGNYYWEVYLNNGSGFSSTATNWSVPSNQLNEITQDNSLYYWVTTDINGDKKPDLINTRQSAIFGSSGNYYWKVYLNSGTGFSSTAVNWPVPSNQLSETYANNGMYYWAMMDMNGDFKADLVNTRQGSSSVFGSSGNYYWEVYVNTGSGFSASATAWSVPSNQLNETAISNSLSYWLPMDIDGNGTLDMINTRQSSIFGSSGNYYWKVYMNQSTPSDIFSIETKEILVYPNPTTGPVKLELPADVTGELIITDASGRFVLRQNIRSGLELDLSSCEPGLYYGTVISEGRKSFFRVIRR